MARRKVPAAVALEIQKRAAIRRLLHQGPQREAVLDPSPLRIWQCSRRAGKTTGAMIQFFDDGFRHPGSEYAYVALTRNSAERIAWNIVRKINRELKLQAYLQPTRLRVILPNEAALTLYGADRTEWMDRLYGQKLRQVWIDEAAFFRTSLGYFIDDVLEPAVADEEGQITLLSKPGHVPRGYYHDRAVGNVKGWSVHKWTWQDNPAVKRQVEALIARKIADDPNYLDRSTTRQNWFNEWVSDLGDRVYRFDHEKNSLDEYTKRPGDRYILGIDLGWHDYTAFSVLCWREDSPELIEVESYREKEMLLDRAAAVCRLYAEAYPGLQMYGDPSRRQAFEELRRRYSLPIVAAERAAKKDWIELINSDFEASTIRVVAPESSPHVEEMTHLVWMQRPNGDHVEDPKQKNDTCDAFLYAYRAAYHYRYKPEPAKPPTGSEAYWREEEAKMERAAEKHFNPDPDSPWWDS